MKTEEPKDRPEQPDPPAPKPDADQQDGGTDPGVPEGPGKTPPPPPPPSNP